MSAAPGPLRQALVLARKDLCIESRTREILLVVTPFGALALVLVPISVGTDAPLLRTVGPGVYWSMVTLFGALVTLRQSALDPPALVAALRLAGTGPAVRLAARAAANTVLLLVFEVLLLPVMIAVYDPEAVVWGAALLVLPLVAVGMGVLGAVTGALTHGLAERSALGPLLLVPLGLPLLLGAGQVGEAARYGRPAAPWLLLIVTVDLAAVVLAAMSAPHLEEVA